MTVPYPDADEGCGMKHKAKVAIVGGGIAGAWLAYRLSQRGIHAVVIRHAAEDTPTVSHRAASVFNKQVIECVQAKNYDTLSDIFSDDTETQHRELKSTIQGYLRREFEEYSTLVPVMPFVTYLIPKSDIPFPRLGAGENIVSDILKKAVALGGEVVEGRVTHLAVSDGVCHGVQYEQNGEAHKVLCNALVIASGGYSGLLPDAPTGNTGDMLGLYLRHGGKLANLEILCRFAFGDLSKGRVLYPDDMRGAQMTRAGEPATWLTNAYATLKEEEERDIHVFQQYWTKNGGIPHTLTTRDGKSFDLGPIYGYSGGGVAQNQWRTSLGNVFALGEARHDVVLNNCTGTPWASALARGGMLCDELARKEWTTREGASDFELVSVSLPVQPALLSEVRQRIRAFLDHRFTQKSASSFVEWCRTTRRTLTKDRGGCVNVLLLAEAYALSALARQESVGYFFRGDFPTHKPVRESVITTAHYDAKEESVKVELLPSHLYYEQFEDPKFQKLTLADTNGH